MQSSYLQTNKRNKKRYQEEGYEESPNRGKNGKKPKKDFSEQRKFKRGE